MASDNNLQKPNIYNKFSPFNKFINEQSSILFDEIRENLSRTIQLGELEPGFTIWSIKLKQFLTIYGFNFTKVDHLKLINFYLSILSIIDLNYRYVEICLDMLFGLMRFVYSKDGGGFGSKIGPI
jgi:proteasome activator subunit 4